MKLIQYILFFGLSLYFEKVSSADYADDTFYFSFELFNPVEVPLQEEILNLQIKYGKEKAPIVIFKDKNLQGAPIFKLFTDGIQYKENKKKQFKEICIEQFTSISDQARLAPNNLHNTIYKDFFYFKVGLKNRNSKELKKIIDWNDLYCKSEFYWSQRINKTIFKTHFKDSDFYILLPKEIITKNDKSKKEGFRFYLEDMKYNGEAFVTKKFFDKKIRNEKYYKDLKKTLMKCSKEKNLECLKELDRDWGGETTKKASATILEYLNIKKCEKEFRKSACQEKRTHLGLDIEWQELEKVALDIGAYWNNDGTSIYFTYQSLVNNTPKKLLLIFQIEYSDRDQSKVLSKSILLKNWSAEELINFYEEY